MKIDSLRTSAFTWNRPQAGAEEVTNKLIEVISAIIGEKKFTKKKYTDSRQRLDSEVSKAVSLVQVRSTTRRIRKEQQVTNSKE
jgi:hypothetical protein